MKVSRELINEILKLNKREWGNVKITIDYLFDTELKNKEKEIFIPKENLEKRIKSSPCFIELEK